MKLAVAGIDWDSGNIEKCQKHGLSLELIEAFLLETDLHVEIDNRHSSILEQRFLAIGQFQKRWIFVAFTFRSIEGKDFLRPISARYMREKEVRRYEEKCT